MRIGIVGGGVAGALLAWRLRQAAPSAVVEVRATMPPQGDATGASGGLVRGFEREPGACRLAAASLAELRADRELSSAAAYREVGSVYLMPPGPNLAAPVAIVEELLPGSVAVLDRAQLRAGHPFRRLPPGTVAVVERHAGYLSPAGLRAAVMARLASEGVTVATVPVVALEPPDLRLADGGTASYDAVVLATGAWTPALLARSGLAGDGLRTRQIQYTVYRTRVPPLGAFVDERTGLYGRPDGVGRLLLGLPCDRWDVDPDAVRPDADLVERVATGAYRLLGVPGPRDRPERTVAAFDCYRDPPGLTLRRIATGAPAFSFTGGSGGAAKSALAASRAAAAALLAALGVTGSTGGRSAETSREHRG